jgi:carboxylesterase type B
MGATQSIHRPVILETPTKGSLRGIEQLDRKSGKVVCRRYTRIPYALPPTGDRRWKRPVALGKDFTFNFPNGEPGNYAEFANICPQPVYALGSAMLENEGAAPEPPKYYSEDCLYLNIWVPGGKAPEKGWPVQFFLRLSLPVKVALCTLLTYSTIDGGWLQVGDANQSNNHDPYDLLADFPRVIVVPSYRLNLFGFMTCSELASESTGQYPPGNYGFWDQRLALEWTYSNISLFGGNKDNIIVGGLSAGAHSTVFQLHYDTHRPNAADRIIRGVYLWSNAVGIQPNSVISTSSQAQFEELLKAFGISVSLSSEEKLKKLRALPDSELAAKIPSMENHTFRAGTDDDFIPSNFLASIHDGSFTDLLSRHDIRVLLGEVADEEMLYRLINPASSYSTMITQLNNYYPTEVTNSLLKIYPLPSSSVSKSEWRNTSARIVADCQVHATIRGFAASLLNPPPGHSALSLNRVFRYRISWRAKGLDAWLDPAVGVCHASDIPIWWQSGRRAGFTADDIEKSTIFLKPFEQFLAGDDVQWRTKDMKEVREFAMDGTVRVVEDEGWDRGMEVWNTMWQAQSKQSP